jgi:DNA-binding NarL/FixJ family response regulator
MGKRDRPRILIAEDHTLVAEAFKKLLDTEFEIVGLVSDGQALLDAFPRLNPDVVLVDIAMPLLNGLEACERIRALSRIVKIVFLTMNQDRAVAAEAFHRGASGYLLKTSASSELLAAIRAVLKGKPFISRSLAGDSFELKVEYEGSNRVPGPLTPRQRQVLQLLAEGHTMKKVADLLSLTPRTIAFHKYRIMGILHLKNNAELVQYAIREHITPV